MGATWHGKLLLPPLHSLQKLLKVNFLKQTSLFYHTVFKKRKDNKLQHQNMFESSWANNVLQEPKHCFIPGLVLFWLALSDSSILYSDDNNTVLLISTAVPDGASEDVSISVQCCFPVKYNYTAFWANYTWTLLFLEILSVAVLGLLFVSCVPLFTSRTLQIECTL